MTAMGIALFSFLTGFVLALIVADRLAKNKDEKPFYSECENRSNAEDYNCLD